MLISSIIARKERKEENTVEHISNHCDQVDTIQSLSFISLDDILFEYMRKKRIQASKNYPHFHTSNLNCLKTHLICRHMFCVSLKELVANGLPCLTDDGIKYFCLQHQNARMVTHLSLFFCVNLSTLPVNYICNYCHELVRLDIFS